MCPGVRPIGVGEVPRRIITKANRIIGGDVEAAGHSSYVQAKMVAVRPQFMPCNTFSKPPETEAVLLVDATNAFNRKAALHSISIICPSLAQALINTYRAPVRLFITGSGKITFTKGTTQGNPLVMAMYALTITPLIVQLRDSYLEVH